MLLLAAASVPARSEPFSLLVTFGHDGVVRNWDGEVSAEGGEVTSLAPWKMFDGDRVFEPASWRYRSGRERRHVKAGMQKLVEPPGEPLPGGVFVNGDDAGSGMLEFSTRSGNFAVRLNELKWGRPQRFLDGAVEVLRLAGAEKLSTRRRENDFPSIAASPDGGVWAAWQSFDGEADTVRLARWSAGRWNSDTPIPGSRGRVWAPAVAVDEEGVGWVFWSQQTGGNWDLFAAVHRGASIEGPYRLTDAPGADFNVQAVRDSQGRLAIVWQAERGGYTRILLKRQEGKGWSREIPVSDPKVSANAWAPSACADRAGRVHVAWDSYRSGDYDVWMRSVAADGKLADAVRVTATPRYEANASIACGPRGDVWLAWESGPQNWGKDLAEELPGDGPGAALGDPMRVEVRVFEGATVKAPVSPVAEAFPENERLIERSPQLSVGSDGRVWLLFRHQTVKGRTDQYSTTRGRGHWASYLTSYEGDRWSPAAYLPASSGRISSFGALAAADEGGVWAVWNGSDRDWLDILQPQENHVYAGRIAPPTGAVAELQPFIRTAYERTADLHADEPGDLHRIRAYRAETPYGSYRILRGDLHRHSEFSRDQGNGRDGSTLDFYRYMLDAGAMDFGALTEHSDGYDTRWTWHIQKLADLFHRSSYTALYGYERTATYPFGHRNIIHARRGVPRIDIFTRDSYSEGPPNLQVDGENIVENDTALLHRELRRTGGIAVAHTTGSTHGTDWNTVDNVVEPVVELYQGLRQNYERLNAPRAFREGEAPRVYREQGMVSNAWTKGQRLGVIASSDHVSTHASYAMVYTDDSSREGIIEAIRARRTYAATDNIVLDVRSHGRMMGAELAGEETPEFVIRVRGTAPVARLVVVKDNEAVYAAEPRRRTVDLSWRDQQGPRGTSFYYVRVEQSDGQLAWSSPFWVSDAK